MRNPSPGTPAADLVQQWRDDVRRRLASLRLSPEREADIVDELVQHLEDRWRELVAGGASADEAAQTTRAEFQDGNVLAGYLGTLQQAHQPPPITPGSSVGHMLGDVHQDFRYALRTMVARPGFTVVAVLSLALGIGANTAIFSLWNGVLHASLPGVTAPEQLVMLSNPNESGMWNGRLDGARPYLTYSEFEDLRDQADSFSGVLASQASLNTWSVRIDGGDRELASGRLVSGGFFEVLGVGPALGRLFTPADDRREVPFAVISYRYWQRRFGGRPDALGKSLTINKAPLTIVGVAPRGFIGETSGQQPDLWLPLRMQPRVLGRRDRLHDTPPDKTMWLHVFGRLRPGISPSQAGVQANAIFQAGLQSFYGAAATGDRRREFLNQRLEITSGARGASHVRAEFSNSLTALLAAVAVLLLIACANLANLLLARGAARKGEIALRLALGASRARLVRQLVTESLVLAALGSVVGVAVAYGLHGPIVALLARSDSRFDMSFSLDVVVLLFLLGATAMATLISGVLPAWQVTRVDSRAPLTEQSRGAIGSRRQLRSGRVLVGLQLALSLPLLVGAGLLARTAYNVQRADLGFPADHLLLIRVDLREGDAPTQRSRRRLDELVARIQSLPGVRSTSFSHLGLFTGGESRNSIAVEDFVLKSDNDRDSAADQIGPHYFSTLGIPMRLGRDILDSDIGSSRKVCVINDLFARKFFQLRNPIGLHITLVDDPAERTACEIVGVARDARTAGLRGEVEARFFRPATSAASPTLLIRTTTDPRGMVATVQNTIRSVDATLPIVSSATLEDQLEPLTAQDRTAAQLAVVFGSVALALAAIGLYGVLSYGVAQRTGEIAIRIALGAHAARVMSMILGETMAMCASGLAIGGAIAYAASRLIESRLYGVAPHDPLTLAAATGLLLVVALAATYAPASRASRVHPMTALRQS